MKLSTWNSHRQTSSWCSQTWCERSLMNSEMKREDAFSLCWFQTLCLQTCRTFTLRILPCRPQVPHGWNGAALGDSLPSATWAKVQTCKALKLCFYSPLMLLPQYMLFLPHTVFLGVVFFVFCFKACPAFTYAIKKSLTQVNWAHRTALLGHNKTLLWRAKSCRDKAMLDDTPGFFSSKQVSINLTKEK